jgi:uroporphyrinogen-III synthase
VSALAGRRVVVTRAADQADGIAELLAARGAEAVVVPLIEIVADPAEVQRLGTLRPAAFEWLVVTSPNAAMYFAATHTTGTHTTAPPNVAAVGATTAAALARAGVTATLVPARQSAAGLLAEFPAARPSGPSGPTGVLLVQAADAEPALAAGLVALGWSVTGVAPYHSVAVRPGADRQRAALSADAVLFASGSAARAWAEAFGDLTPPIVVAIGPQTAAAAQQAGLKVTLIAADHSVKGMVDALASYLSRSS